ncbi:hypothetical protein Tco_0841820 [Tanacetum coccineum]|uniref:Uncharacterized protein n=1 Tax=Tanacetum coccineum TaxID=301880 RepID=A0ABQ5AYT3_9ASTR
MSQATSLLPMRTEEELVPKDKQVGISTSNVRIDADAVFTDPFHQLAIAILKTHIIYQSLTLTANTHNDTIQEMDAYKEYTENSREVVVSMVQPQPVDPTQGKHKNTRANGVKITGGKRPTRRGECGVLEPATLHITMIVLKRNPTSKDKTASKAKPVKEKRVKEKTKKVKEMYVDDPEQVHVATLLSVGSERLRLERIEREQRVIDEEIDDDLDDTLEAIKILKLKGVALSRRETLIQELSRAQGEGSGTRIETQELRDSLDSNQTLSATILDVVDEGNEDDASNFTVFVHGKQYDLTKKQRGTPIQTIINSPRTQSS